MIFFLFFKVNSFIFLSHLYSFYFLLNALYGCEVYRCSSPYRGAGSSGTAQPKFALFRTQMLIFLPTFCLSPGSLSGPRSGFCSCTSWPVPCRIPRTCAWEACSSLQTIVPANCSSASSDEWLQLKRVVMAMLRRCLAASPDCWQ